MKKINTRSRRINNKLKYVDGKSGLINSDGSINSTALNSNMMEWFNSQNITPLSGIHASNFNLKNDYSNVANNALGFTASMTNSFSKPSLQYQPTYSQHNGPLSYDEQSSINSSMENKALKQQNTMNTIGSVATGAQLGSSIMPGIGTAIGAVTGLVGGLLGGSSRKRKLQNMMYQQQKSINASNNYSLANALNTKEQQDYYTKYGDTTDDVLFANTGKTPFVSDKDGNAYVGKGETIVNGNTGQATEVQGGKGVGIDDVSAKIAPQDAILGNLLNPATGNTFADDAKPLTRMEKKLERNKDRNKGIIAKNTEELVHRFTDPRMQQLIQTQAAVHNGKDDNAKIHAWDGFTPSWLSNNVAYKLPSDWPTTRDTNKYGMYTFPEVSVTAKRTNPVQQNDVTNNSNEIDLSSVNPYLSKVGKGLPNLGYDLASLSPIIYNYMQGNKQSYSTTPDNFNASNPYESTIVNGMASRKYNATPEINALGNQVRMMNYRENQSSDTGVNRYMRLANNVNLMNMMGDIYGKKQQYDNQYAGDYYNTLSSLGANDAARLTAAKQLSYDTNMKNNAARRNYTATALSQLSDYVQGNKKQKQEVDWMNKYFDLYHKNLDNKTKNKVK